MQIRKKQQDVIDKREKKNKHQVGLKELPVYKTIYKIIWNVLNAEIPKRNVLY
jgi:hypothetical protein